MCNSRHINYLMGAFFCGVSHVLPVQVPSRYSDVLPQSKHLLIRLNCAIVVECVEFIFSLHSCVSTTNNVTTASGSPYNTTEKEVRRSMLYTFLNL